MNAALLCLWVAATPAADDVVRKAMADEMARAMSELRIPDEPRPHRISYTVTDAQHAVVGATFGAVTTANPRRWRNLRVEVRVGDRTVDSGNFADAASSFADFPLTLPIEDDYLALRRELWLRTDEAFKRAVDAIGKKRAAEKAQARSEEEAPFDYAEAKPAQTPAAPAGQGEKGDDKLDPEGLAKVATALSGLLREYPGIHSSRAGAEQVIVRQRLLTSDGSWKDQRRTMVEVSLIAETQAEDGMRLRSWSVFQAASPQGLPALAAMTQEAKAMAAELTATRKAPVGDNGNAVVLFEGRAAGQLLRRLLADHLSGTPPPRAPATGRAAPVATSELASKLGQKIGPAFLEVYDDPLQEVGPDKTPLFGAYQIDDEGTAAERVSLVEKGLLKSLLMSRTPRKELVRSNGHGRGRVVAGAVRGRAGVLHVSAGKAGLAGPALRASAVKAAKAAGKDVPVYIVRLIDSMVGAGVQPLRVFRVRDGKEEPVRGISFNSLLPRSLKDLVAMGKQPLVYNYLVGSDGHVTAGGAPGSVVAPSVVFKDVEVKKDTDKHPRAPLYPHPYFADK